jgi:GPH family glycoside/pentoside/hexuronide:cation symporter
MWRVAPPHIILSMSTSAPVESLPLSRQLAYATGQLGWSILVNIVGINLVYFYLPPDTSGLPTLITTATFLVVLNAITLVLASGRLLDAFTDPWIAGLSDRSQNPRGRRIPFMAKGAFPAAIFLFLMFVPPVSEQSTINIVWLAVFQALFYVTLTFYLTPFFALLPELGHTPRERLNLSTWISITFALGLILAGLVPGIASAVETAFDLSPLRAFQATIGALAALAAALMSVPVLTIDEKRYSRGVPSNVPLLEAVEATFANVEFRKFVTADFVYFTGLTIVQTGILYYVTVLLEQEETLASLLLTVLVLASFLFYPFVNLVAKRFGKKGLMVGSFAWMSLVFAAVPTLGNLPIDATAQGYALVLLLSVPLAVLGVLPNAVLADIADADARKTGEAREGMFFASRTLMQKVGQTTGVVVFAMATTLGRDIGDDLGVRLSGVIGFVLCLIAAVVFSRYDERSTIG